MARALTIYLLIAVCGLALACGKSDKQAAARIGETVITAGMIKDEYLGISPSARPDLKTIDEKEAFARDIVAKEILKMEARARGIDRLPEVQQTRTGAQSRRAYQAFYEEEIRGKVSVTDKQVQDLFAKQNKGYHLAWILVRSTPLANELARRARQGEDFASLAATYSIDGSRGQGGELGIRTLGTLPPPVEEKIAAMSPGEISDGIPYDSYGIVVKLLGVEPSESGSLDEGRASLEAVLRAAGENSRQREIVAELKRTYQLAFNAAVVDMVVAKTKALFPAAGDSAGAIPEFSDEEMDRVVAEWKGGTMKVRDYVQNLSNLRDYMRPGVGVDADGIKSLVGDFITGQLWGLEIKAKGYESRPDVARAGERAAEEVMITLVHDQLVRDVKLDEGAIRTFYEEHKSELVTEPSVRVAVIVSADSAESQKIYDQLGAGAKFEALAAEKSIDRATAPNGGELMRPLYKQEIEQFPDFQEVIGSLSPGAYSTPMPVPAGLGPAGFMVVRVLERIDSRPLALEEIQGDLEQRVLTLEQDRVFADWLKSKMDEYKVEVYPDGLNAIQFETLKAQGA